MKLSSRGDKKDLGIWHSLLSLQLNITFTKLQSQGIDKTDVATVGLAIIENTARNGKSSADELPLRKLRKNFRNFPVD